MNDLTEQEESFFSVFLDVFLPVTLLSDHSDLFEHSLLPAAPPLKTALRLSASASLHASCCNAQLMSGYMTFFLFSARAVSQPLSNAAPCQVACLFLEKVFLGTARQNRYSVPHLTRSLLPSRKAGNCNCVSRELYHAGSHPPVKCQLVYAPGSPVCPVLEYIAATSVPLGTLEISAVFCWQSVGGFPVTRVLGRERSECVCHGEPT